MDNILHRQTLAQIKNISIEIQYVVVPRPFHPVNSSQASLSRVNHELVSQMATNELPGMAFNLTESLNKYSVKFQFGLYVSMTTDTAWPIQSRTRILQIRRSTLCLLQLWHILNEATATYSITTKHSAQNDTRVEMNKHYSYKYQLYTYRYTGAALK